MSKAGWNYMVQAFNDAGPIDAPADILDVETYEHEDDD